MANGLDDVVAADTVLSAVDGAAGRLVLRGTPLEALGQARFEDAAVLLWHGFVAGAEEADFVARRLGAARQAAFARLPDLLAAARGLPPVEGLRLMMASLADDMPDVAFRLTGALPVFIAALHRAALGRPQLPPDAALGQAADFLRMLDGRPAAPEHVRALDTYLVTIADHGLNASTFTARVIASTGAGLVSAAVGALGALKGPLHGGAPGPVLDLLDALRDEPDIGAALARRVEQGERLMGFGHRIYKVRDPRAEMLKRVVRRLASPRLAFAERVEAAALDILARAKPGRHLETNVEFYTALLLDAVGVPRALFTPVFAMGRILGWTAHVAEQQRSGRIIRPQSRYVGPAPAAAA